MDAKAASLFLADEEKGVSVPVAQKGLSENYLHAKPMKIEAAIRKLMESGGYLAFRDAASDPRLDNHEAKKAEGIASILAVPVMVSDRGIGVLSLYTASPRDFSDDEIAFLSALAEQGGMAIQQARLMERIRKNSMLFLDMSVSINSSLNPKQILHILTADIAEAFGMKGVGIRLLNRAGVLELAASYGLSEEFIASMPVFAAEAMDSVLKGGVLMIEDAAADRHIQNKEALKKEGIMSVLCVPIQSGKEIIGAMRLYSSVKRKFPEEVVISVRALANQGGIAIEKARLVKRMQMNTELFHDLAVSINSTLDIRKIMHIMSADIAETIGVKASSVRLLDENREKLELVASYGLSEKYLNKGPISAEKGIPEALRNRAVVVKHVGTDEGVQYRAEKKEEGIVSILSVPINARDEVIGVLRLYSDVPREFTEDDIMLATAMSHQGGLAIQNASMYLMLQEDKKNLEEDIWSHRSWF